MIELTNATKLYGTVIGVNDISLSLAPGTYGLLGPNGSGKTTLINLILGQLRPTIGQVRLFGENPWSRSRLLSRIGLCPALEVSFPRMTGYDWVKFLVKLHGFSDADSHSRALAALEEVRLTQHMNRPMQNYSLGMRQRAKLAQSIAHDPELLILDEPFNGLDPIGRFEMTALLRKWAGQGKSIILASHILHEVEAINPSFLLISGGRLLASGSPDEVKDILADPTGLGMISTEPNDNAGSDDDDANGNVSNGNVSNGNVESNGTASARATGVAALRSVSRPPAAATITVRSDQPRRLAVLLIEHDLADGVELTGDEAVRISTRNMRELQMRLPGLLVHNGIVVHELVSGDDSLKTLFSTLMQVHRGETRRGTLK